MSALPSCYCKTKIIIFFDIKTNVLNKIYNYLSHTLTMGNKSPHQSSNISSKMVPAKQQAYQETQLIFYGKPPDEQMKTSNEPNRKQRMSGDDKRKRKHDTHQYPYSAIGLIQIDFNGEIYYGTGFLIGPNLVLTCAHNCYHEQLKAEAKSLKFYPALNGHIKQALPVKVKKMSYPKEYTQSAEEEDRFDVAVLELEESIGDRYGTFGLDFSAKKQGEQAYLYGYPGNIYINDGKEQEGEEKMFGMEGKWKIYETQIRYYSISTTRGQSGSPIFIKKNGKYLVIGIHISSGEENNKPFNYGLHLDDRVKKIINSLIIKIPGKPFLDMEMFSKQELEDLTTLQLYDSSLNIARLPLEMKHQTHNKD